MRNHGAVPQVLDDEIPDWEVSIEGLVEQPIVLTFRQILEEFEQVTLPVTLVCAGNRRKEQNVVRKSQGFSWGAGGLSTGLFTGPMLADVVRRAKPTRQARFLWMEGADQLVCISTALSSPPLPPFPSMWTDGSQPAQWKLRHFGQAELGDGP